MRFSVHTKSDCKIEQDTEDCKALPLQNLSGNKVETEGESHRHCP